MKAGAIKHGTYGAYNHHRCRCPPCTEAGRKHMADYRASLGGRTRADIAQDRARVAAVKWVRDNHPDVWKDLLDRANAGTEL